MKAMPPRPQEHAPTGIVARALVALLRDGTPVEFVANGASMWPLIRGGAIVRVVPRDAADLRVGEVAAYETSRGSIVVHRIVERLGDGRIVFRGDGLAVPDPPISASAILGVVTVLRQRALTVRLPRMHEWTMVLRAAVRIVSLGRSRVG